MLRLYIYVIMRLYLYMLCGAMLALASCTNDTLQEMKPDYTGKPETSAMPDGTYLVDYTVDNGASTRAGGKLPVSSLDYYVYYKEGGVLLKHRRISIPANQQWPLTRDNMTWEQRQALQDTLICGVDYRILFIANVDSALFNYDGYSAENPHPAVVKGDTLYQNARILLPNVPFHDDNMYCLWEGALNCTESKGVVNRNDILLQRIVTRTDVSRTENPTDLYTAIENGFYETNCSANVEKAVSDWINDFCDRINKCAHGGDTGLGHPFYEIRGFKDEINSLTALIQSNLPEIQASYKQQVIQRYVEIVQSSNIYTGRMENWYSPERTSRAGYIKGTRANAIGFDRTSCYEQDNGDEALCGMVTEDGIVRIIGFAGGEMCTNTVSALYFYDASESPIFSISGTGTSFSIQQGINLWYKVECDPVNKVWFVSDFFSDKEDTINLDEIMSNSAEVATQWDGYMENTGLMNAINGEFFKGCNLDHAGPFKGYSFTNFPIHVSLPDITSENVDDGRIELIPSWSDPKQVVEE